MIYRSFVSVSTIGIFCLFSQWAGAQEMPRSFTDVPPGHFAYQAVEYLRQQGIIQGYDDGTFRPDRGVNRAEATKIIVAPLISKDDLTTVTESVFEDVPTDAWYLPYIEWGRKKLGIIDGPPKKNLFYGEHPVLKVEFLKMLLIAHGHDSKAFDEVRIPLSSDVTDPEEWFYPYVRYAIASSMIMIGEDGLLHPGKALTRGEVAVLLYRLLMYADGRRTQALLSETENELLIIMKVLEEDNIVQAEYASARSTLAARGALKIRSDSSVVKGAVKISEAFHILVRAYRAGINRDFQTVIDHTAEAWKLASKAVEFSPDLQTIATQVQDIAHSMAEEARTLLSKKSSE